MRALTTTYSGGKIRYADTGDEKRAVDAIRSLIQKRGHSGEKFATRNYTTSATGCWRDFRASCLITQPPHRRHWPTLIKWQVLFILTHPISF